jgi:hypothetical protein
MVKEKQVLTELLFIKFVFKNNKKNNDNIFQDVQVVRTNCLIPIDAGFGNKKVWIIF